MSEVIEEKVLSGAERFGNILSSMLKSHAEDLRNEMCRALAAMVGEATEGKIPAYKVYERCMR